MNLYLKLFGVFCKKINFYDNFKYKSWFDINDKLFILFEIFMKFSFYLINMRFFFREFFFIFCYYIIFIIFIV